MTPRRTHQMIGAMTLAETLHAPACGDDAGGGMTDVDTNSETVFVAFSSIPSAGD